MVFCNILLLFWMINKHFLMALQASRSLLSPSQRNEELPRCFLKPNKTPEEKPNTRTTAAAGKEIRKQFNIVNDFTPEEEAQVRSLLKDQWAVVGNGSWSKAGSMKVLVLNIAPMFYARTFCLLFPFGLSRRFCFRCDLSRKRSFTMIL